MKAFRKFVIILGIALVCSSQGAPLKITGIVRDSTGAPVAGVHLSVIPGFGANNLPATSDSNGQYEITWQTPQNPGFQSFTFSIIARDFERNQVAMREIDEKTTNLDLNLEPGMTVSAQIQDVKGKPITTATAHLYLFSENRGFPIDSQPSKTDDQGRINIPALPQRQRYSFNVSAKGYGSANEQMDAANTQTNRYDFPPFTLNAADKKLAGRVLDTDGKPVAKARVQIYGNGQPNDSVETDEKGDFTFDAVCDGPINVSAYAPQGNQNGYTQTSGGDTRVVIRLNANNRVYNMATIKVTGTVFDTLGAPDAGARVIVTPSFGIIGDGKSDEVGKYSVTWQPQPGIRNIQYYLIARDVEHNLAVAQRITEKETNVDLHLESGFSISGTVQDADGAPLTRAMLNLNFMAGNYGGLVDTQPVRVDNQGNFTIAALPTGQRYNLNVAVKGYGSAYKSLQPAEIQNGRVQLPPFKLKLADRVLAGQVVGSDNKPVVGAQVQINGQGQPNDNIRTDSDGHFSFKVCEGQVSIFAYSQNNGQFIQGQIQAFSGETNIVVKLGVNQAGIARSAQRLHALKQQPWTLAAVVHWFVGHGKTTVGLVGLQLAALVGTAVGILWYIIRNPAD